MFNTSELDELFRILISIKGFKLKQPQGSNTTVEAGHAVREIPTWMGLTAKWRVKCVSLAEAKDILAGCKRLEQENRRRELQYFQERFAPPAPTLWTLG